MQLLRSALLPLFVISASTLVVSGNSDPLEHYPTGRLLPYKKFRLPESAQVDAVNGLIGNGGVTPDGSGGMIPAVGPPFGMTRWVAQTAYNYVSSLPYNYTHTKHHGMQSTHQPAIWMGESCSHAIVSGVSPDGSPSGVEANFTRRGLPYVGGLGKKGNEMMSPSYYSVELEDTHGGEIFAELTATSRVGYTRFTFTPGPDSSDAATPYILIDAARRSTQTSTESNYTFPIGHVNISVASNEISGYSSERQDSIITPNSGKESADHFKGFFVARFDPPLSSSNVTVGLIANDTLVNGTSITGPMLNAYVMYHGEETKKPFVVSVKVGTSFISIEQARKNLEMEIPDSSQQNGAFEAIARQTRTTWAEKLDRVAIEGATPEQLEVFYTAMVHAMTYPYETHENGQYYSAYDNKIHEGDSYNGYSNWDVFRGEWGFITMMAPERIPGMMRSMLQDYVESGETGRLPMWKNIAETNIMVGTTADSMCAEVMVKNFTGFDLDLVWEAVWKDATVPPLHDKNTRFSDREENVDYEARAGLGSNYSTEGWVACDVHSEAGSRTLDYAYEDYCVYKIAQIMGKPDNVTDFLYERSQKNPFTIWNNETGFMEARNADGSWAGPDACWTEGDKWVYTFDVVQAMDKLIEHRGGRTGFVKSLEEFYNGGHNQFTNEPSEHVTYLYNYAGAAMKTQERVREMATQNYNNTPIGISGNEDCGQMSAWFIWSSMGMYAVNPADAIYAVGSPFYDKMTIDLPRMDGSGSNRLTITAKGAAKNPYVKSVTLNGKPIETPFVNWSQFINGGDLVFEMSSKPEAWGNDPDIMKMLLDGKDK
ncbi:hypothetical protein AGABI1DRAFT_131606 [Agaricus bisporus var. burnettii JB137-S8]|uniref:Glycoside hydrolase family 92 protein n=1 Tax=Agaricus bisporus var. burnettii (strain JB137-S8 / ATCC MYA-4627 / FGSC 10392) TaxID=597362 RepID=K5WZS2_AGABU|nr:uncharacterized protein AGABI1DRAFT_131606 [Agaricus bisporus var. burnettii JB137-S8]EKM76087.1 hypothetical protein AGABI1DRAFT_131606 [Agaricus bisporus var. burnettii JB137-S8]